MTELAIQELKFDAKINTSIELENEKTLDNLVSQVEAKYSTMVYTDENEKEAKQDKAELNKIIKKIDDERKKVKKTYNEPLKEFEDKMKNYTSRISDVIAPIDAGIKDLDCRQREQRRKNIEDFIVETAPNYNLEPSEINIEENWLNKSHSNVQRTRLITDAMKLVNMRKEERQRELDVVNAYCTALNFEAEAWIMLLDEGKTSVEIIKLIDESIKRKKEEQLKREEQLKQEELQKQEQVNQEPIQDTYVIDNVEKEPIEELSTIILKFTATDKELDLLNDFIVQHNLKVEQI